MSTNISEEITNIVDALTLSKNLLEKALHKIEILSNDTLANRQRLLKNIDVDILNQLNIDTDSIINLYYDIEEVVAEDEEIEKENSTDILDDMEQQFKKADKELEEKNRLGEVQGFYSSSEPLISWKMELIDFSKVTPSEEQKLQKEWDELNLDL